MQKHSCQHGHPDFFTARSDEIDRILGFELGFDGYVTKPFSPREVTARIKTILRRVSGSGDEATTSLFAVDDGKKEISFMGSSLTLTPFEFGILSELLSRPSTIF